MFTVGELDDELVHGLAVAVLDDLDGDEVTAHRADPTGDGTQCARPVGELHPEQKGRHVPRLRPPRERFVSTASRREPPDHLPGGVTGGRNACPAATVRPGHGLRRGAPAVASWAR